MINHYKIKIIINMFDFHLIHHKVYNQTIHLLKLNNYIYIIGLES